MEPMLLYIAATNRVVSVVLVVERKEAGKEQPVQRPVYYLSEVLSQSKQNYPHYQKVTYGVYMAAKKLKHYFQEHPIKVVATAPLAEIIGSKDANGRVAKWALELAAHAIQYEPRTAIKSHPSRLLPSGDWDAKDANMASYRFHVQQPALSEAIPPCAKGQYEGGRRPSKIGSTGRHPPGVALRISAKPSHHTLPGLGFHIRAG
ncbi:hypothetical protein QYE76_052405 [Lolium multiflorum]|uniref:Reverse transcriptase RNase H-like domain-containing protein n=1 Tax=Lolium multiflorum TaxID=4521 RepID=A0AAD8STV3_LOLMU|nr:hypothetical protein QYE76_052405 [Lolium multiflorum]